MRSILLSLIPLLCLAIPSTSYSAELICVVAPMYPYSGEYWMHYCMRNSPPTACTPLGPIGRIDLYTLSQKCANNECFSGLGEDRILPEGDGDAYYGGERPVPYASVNTPDKMRAFIKVHCDMSQHARVDSLQFRTPDVAGPEVRPSVIEVQRKKMAGGTEAVYFVLWRLSVADGSDAFMGIQLDQHPGHQVGYYVADEVHRAREKGNANYKEVKGVIEVRRLHTTYLVRLYGSDENKRPDAFPPIRQN